MPEMTTFYLNQAYQSYKDNKRICYWDLLIFGQVTPFLNPPEDLSNFEVKDNEAKIVRPKYDTVSDQFLDLVETLGYLTVRGDTVECFFDYGYFNRINFRGDQFSRFSRIFPPSAKISTREKFGMMPTPKINTREKNDKKTMICIFFFNSQI